MNDEPTKEHKIYACKFRLVDVETAINAYTDYLGNPNKEPIEPMKEGRIKGLVWLMDSERTFIKGLLQQIHRMEPDK